MNISDIKKNIYLKEDTAIAWVNLTAAGHEVSHSYVMKIVNGERKVNSVKSKIVLAELERIAQANIRAKAEKKNLPVKSKAQQIRSTAAL